MGSFLPTCPNKEANVTALVDVFSAFSVPSLPTVPIVPTVSIFSSSLSFNTSLTKHNKDAPHVPVSFKIDDGFLRLPFVASL